jgi:hypothetical protein
MVQLHYKKTEHNQFLYDTTVNAPIEDVIRNLVESKREDFIHYLNLQPKSKQFSCNNRSSCCSY